MFDPPCQHQMPGSSSDRMRLLYGRDGCSIQPPGSKENLAARHSAADPKPRMLRGVRQFVNLLS